MSLLSLSHYFCHDLLHVHELIIVFLQEICNKNLIDYHLDYIVEIEVLCLNPSQAAEFDYSILYFLLQFHFC